MAEGENTLAVGKTNLIHLVHNNLVTKHYYLRTSFKQHKVSCLADGNIYHVVVFDHISPQEQRGYSYFVQQIKQAKTRKSRECPHEFHSRVYSLTSKLLATRVWRVHQLEADGYEYC